MNELLAQEQEKSEISSVNEMNAVTQQERGVPVDPKLKNIFDSLTYIDAYRITGDVRMLDELIYNNQSPVDNDYASE